MYPWERHQVGLEFAQVDVHRSLETKGCCDAGDYRCYEPIEVLAVWARDVEGLLTDVVDSFIVDQKRAVTVLNRGMG
jgi:hypothetical protein